MESWGRLRLRRRRLFAIGAILLVPFLGGSAAQAHDPTCSGGPQDIGGYISYRVECETDSAVHGVFHPVDIVIVLAECTIDTVEGQRCESPPSCTFAC